MLGLPGVNPAPQPMDLSASGAVHPAAGAMYLLAAVALPVMLLILLLVRALGARARWARAECSESVGWAWRAPYELFVAAFPSAATVAGEWIAIAAVASGQGRSRGTNVLLAEIAAGLVVMGVSGVRSTKRVGWVTPVPVRPRQTAGSA